MKEEIARTKWCPMVRMPLQFTAKATGSGMTVGVAAAAINVEPNPVTQAMERGKKQSCCIASDCAMWRALNAERGGYCGLAGAPLD